MNDVEATNVLLTVHDDTCTAHVAATGDQYDVASIELHEVGYLARLEVVLHGVVDPDEGVGVADRATIVGNDVWNALGTKSGLTDLEELVGGLLSSNAVDGEATLNVVEETEVLARLLNRNHI